MTGKQACQRCQHMFNYSANAPDACCVRSTGLLTLPRRSLPCPTVPRPAPPHPALQLCLAETSLLTDLGFEAPEGLTALRELDVSCWIVRRPAVPLQLLLLLAARLRGALCVRPALACRPAGPALHQ
jgi:hypothetical protein